MEDCKGTMATGGSLTEIYNSVGAGVGDIGAARVMRPVADGDNAGALQPGPHPMIFALGDTVQRKGDSITGVVIHLFPSNRTMDVKLANGLTLNGCYMDAWWLLPEKRTTDPVTGGAKGTKEERYDLLPFDALDELTRVYGVGAQKYDDHNWLKGYKYSLSLQALLRHVSRWAQGEDYDIGPGGTGRHHLACAAWHCFTLMTFQFRMLGTDDRRKSG